MHKDQHLQNPYERLDRDDPDAVIHFVETAHPVDVASLLDELELIDARDRLLSMPLHRRTETFSYLRPEKQIDLTGQLDRRQLAEIVTAMSADDRADLFNQLSTEHQNVLLPGLARAEREDIRRLAGHAGGTAGSIMTSDYATLRPDLTARDALDSLRLEAPEKETIYRAYVVDDSRQLIGAIRLQDLILAEPGVKVEELMQRETLAVSVDQHQETVASRVARYDVLAVPVVDSAGRLVGVVTHDDALDALQEEVTEDFHRIGTVGRLGESVREASIALLFRKRVFWLALLVVGNLFAGMALAFYEDTIAAHVALIFFLPLLIGSSGNAGAQASTLMVRAIATGDVVLRDWAQILGRELIIALALGVTMGLAVAPVSIARGGYAIAATVALTMVLVVVVGSIVGIMLPFLLHRFRLDPATASAPLVTTIADVLGVVIYFTIATAVLA